MAREQSQQLPEELEAWLGQQADKTGRSRTEILARAVMAYQVGENLDYNPLAPEAVAAINRNPERIQQILANAEEITTAVDRLGRVETDLDEQVQDLRTRIIDVLRETESRANADHDHPDLTESLDSLETTLTHQSDRITEVSNRIDTIAGRRESAESDRSSPVETTKETEERLQELASATVKLQRQTAALEQRAERIDRVAEIKQQANQTGTQTAECGSCDRSVNISLLGTPRCPHCDATFDGVVPSSGLFGSATLSHEDRPALEGDVPADPSASDNSPPDNE